MQQIPRVLSADLFPTYIFPTHWSDGIVSHRNVDATVPAKQMHDNSQLLSVSFWYCRQIRLNVPEALIKLINLYNTRYEIFGIGDNSCGHLSISGWTEPLEPTQYNFNYYQNCVQEWRKLVEYENICTHYSNLSGNYMSTTIIAADHSLHFAGCKLYFGTDQNTVHLKQIELNEKVAFVSKGYNSCNPLGSLHCFIYTLDNKLYTNGEYERFTQIPRFWKETERLTDIKCNHRRTLFLTDIGNVYMTEMGKSNKVRSVDSNHKCIAIELGSYFFMLLSINGILSASTKANCDDRVDWKKIGQYFENKQLKIKSMAAGLVHAMVLTENNDCYTFGDNGFGQCGKPRDIAVIHQVIAQPHKLNINDISMMSCGGRHTLVLTNSNKAYSFGNNDFKQCGQTAQHFITKPYYLDKTKELKVKQSAYIECAKAMYNSSIIIINPNKTVRC